VRVHLGTQEQLGYVLYQSNGRVAVEMHVDGVDEPIVGTYRLQDVIALP
jgi:hypothetical protein